MLLIAAICHDLDHDGFTNTFHIYSQSPLAQRYNDKSGKQCSSKAPRWELLQCVTVMLQSAAGIGIGLQAGRSSLGSNHSTSCVAFHEIAAYVFVSNCSSGEPPLCVDVRGALQTGLKPAVPLHVAGGILRSAQAPDRRHTRNRHAPPLCLDARADVAQHRLPGAGGRRSRAAGAGLDASAFALMVCMPL